MNSRITPDLLDPARYAFRRRMPTRFGDLDGNDHINNVAMAGLFEDARVRFDARVGNRPLFEGFRVMVAATNVDYLAEAFYPEPLVIHMAVLAIGRTSWNLGALALQEGRPRAYCRAIHCVTDAGRPTPIPEALRSNLARHLIGPPAPA